MYLLISKLLAVRQLDAHKLCIKFTLFQNPSYRYFSSLDFRLPAGEWGENNLYVYFSLFQTTDNSFSEYILACFTMRRIQFGCIVNLFIISGYSFSGYALACSTMGRPQFECIVLLLKNPWLQFFCMSVCPLDNGPLTIGYIVILVPIY